MIYNGRELTFQQECFLKEINLRGMCMVMSADMEALLLKIILYCIVDDPNATIRKFKGMMMGSKIEMAEKDLKQYHPEEYTKYEDDFKIMWEFNKLRVILAHCLIMWDEEKKSTDFFYYTELIKEQENYRMVRYKMLIQVVIDKLESFKGSIFKMACMAQRMIDEFNHKYPNFLSPSQA